MPPKRGRCTDKSYKQVVSRVLLTTTVLRLGWQQDVWLEAVRLQTPENAKAVLARGVQEIPTSVKLWMQVNRLRGSRELRRAASLLSGQGITGFWNLVSRVVSGSQAGGGSCAQATSAAQGVGARAVVCEAVEDGHRAGEFRRRSRSTRPCC